MTNIKSFNKQTVSTARSEINKKLAELQELGLTIELGNISFDNDSFTGKITCSLQDAENEYAKEFKRSMDFVILGDIINKTFPHEGGTATFLGFKPRARKNNAIFEMNGKKFRIAFSLIRNLLVDLT
jgi:hypothetical protein